MVDTVQNAMTLLCSSNKLEREKGAIELEKVLQAGGTFCNSRSPVQSLQLKLIAALNEPLNKWEVKYGSLLAVKCLVPFLTEEDSYETDFVCQIRDQSLKLLLDDEYRVRLAAGEVLGAICHRVGCQIYENSKDVVLKCIQNNLEQIVDDGNNSSKTEHFERERLMEKLICGPNFIRRSLGETAIAFHSTGGWKNLETSLKALQCMVEGCGTNFIPYIDDELMSIVFKTLAHSNRSVRETGFNLCSSLVKCGGTPEECELLSPVLTYGQELVGHLSNGLADDWSQVRMASSVTTRSFLLSLPEDSRVVFYADLLPRMCLNRYYAADGVRIYSQETWRQVTGAAGKDHVQNFIGPTVAYYQQATQSDNHAVREAACACIAELASKIPAPSLSPYVSSLLSTLLNCFQDYSWPVRDSACLACGNFVLCFPEETRGALDALYPMFFRNLGDPIASVRQGAASSLSNVVRAYGDDALQYVGERIKTGLQDIEKQGDDNNVSEEAQISTRYSAGKRGRDDDSDEQNSFEGIATKLRRGGSYEKTFNRPSHPWELSDGCAYLIGELSGIKEAQARVLELIPLLTHAATFRNYSHHVVFLETICKQLPIMAKNLGKKTFSTVVEHFFDVIFNALESENGLTSSAASQCLNQLATFLGQNILRAKVANYHPPHLTTLESVIYIAPF